MDPLTFYFDRNIGVRLPEALRLLGLKNVVHHNTPRKQIQAKGTSSQTKLFADNEPDDSWLKFVGEKRWIVFTQDRKFHRAGYENEMSAIKQFDVGCFYLWGAEAQTWDKMRAFCRAFDGIVKAAEETKRPFIFDVSKMGRLSSIAIP